MGSIGVANCDILRCHLHSFVAELNGVLMNSSVCVCSFIHLWCLK